MHRALLLAMALAVPCLAQAAGFDAPGLARFDTGYARCEARFAHMKGARDEAYLAIYRVKPDAAARARLAELRRGAAYRKERNAAQADAAKPAASAPASPLEHQCQALWTQVQRARSAVK
ncbi:MAG: hypothetical protein JSR75_02435 [Proteobacteria bacterium]|nr:hypothetical protein [Pseudomonadota bacterium]